MKLNPPALVAIRELLDEMMYALVDFRLSLEVERAPTGFPRFAALQQAITRLAASQQVLFRLFRLGEPVDDDRVRAALSSRALEAFVAAGLLAVEGEVWRTPSLLIVPLEGLYVTVGIPPSYPTATRPCRCWMDLSSYVVTHALPTSMTGDRVLDLCSGSGLLAMVCARRGAARAIGLELDASAVAIATANATLNGLADRVEFRQSDGLTALDADEQVDFVVCNTPYAPVIASAMPAITFGTLGNAVLLTCLDRLPRHLSPHAAGVLASWRAPGHGSSTYQLELVSERLESADCTISAYLDRAPDTIEGVLKIVQGDIATRGLADTTVTAIRDLLERPPQPFDGFYNQLIAFRKRRAPSRSGARQVFGIAAPTPQGAR
jgi:2-polyprenyl-3-methyl-5-hydroxy-6-metoxy-1,4-benzoquinol methylase